MFPKSSLNVSMFTECTLNVPQVFPAVFPVGTPHRSLPAIRDVVMKGETLKTYDKKRKMGLAVPKLAPYRYIIHPLLTPPLFVPRHVLMIKGHPYQTYGPPTWRR
jgi:hypothetical protein